jgi:ParB family chromosome partitioning protein
MSRARKPASPLLGAAMSVIGSAAEALVPQDSRFRHTFEAPLARIRADPDQPRRQFEAAEIEALAATMAAEGQLQPVLVKRDPEARGGWILVAGERRWRAARHNGWTSLLAIEHAGDAALAALLENLQRVDLSPAEEARGVQRLIAERGLSQAQVAGMLGRSAGEISATLRLLDLPAGLLERSAPLPRNLLVELARLNPGPMRDRLLAQAEAGSLTVRKLRAARAESTAPLEPPTWASDPPSDPPVATGREARPLKPTLLQQFSVSLKRQLGKPVPLTLAERQQLKEIRKQIDALLGF